MAETREGESPPRILVPALKGGTNLTHPHRATAPSNVHSNPPGRMSHKGAAYHGKNIPSCQGMDWNTFH